MSGQVRGQVLFHSARLSDEIDRRMLTNDDAAKLLGVPERTLRRWRNGETTPRRTAIRHMALVFERDPRWFADVLDREAA